MGGPTCEVMFDPSPAVDHLQVIDALLTKVSDRIERTRKGRVWTVCIRGRSIDVWVEREDGQEAVILSIGRKSPDDFAALRELSQQLAQALGGLASEPIK